MACTLADSDDDAGLFFFPDEGGTASTYTDRQALTAPRGGGCSLSGAIPLLGRLWSVAFLPSRPQYGNVILVPFVSLILLDFLSSLLRVVSLNPGWRVLNVAYNENKTISQCLYFRITMAFPRHCLLN
jgi:hypothetical protein